MKLARQIVVEFENKMINIPISIKINEKYKIFFKENFLANKGKTIIRPRPIYIEFKLCSKARVFHEKLKWLKNG